VSLHGVRLPGETTRFFGRSEEIAAIRGAVGRSRLVTLTGPGGVGKTRLAIHVARALDSAFPDGVFLVPLSGLRDDRLLPATVAAALGLPEHAAPDRVAGLLPRLRGQRMLLILDTCEHLLDESAAFADRLLRDTNGPRVIATSRQALDVPGEVVYPITPLAVPDDGGDALALFTDRVQTVMPGFRVTDVNRAQVVMLCRGLDGIPLAIELAAVRIRAAGLAEMLTRLGDRLRLLGGTGRQGAGRHQTLRAMIGWSYDLCSPAERLLWARLSVFAGEFGLEAAEKVCAGDGLARESLVDALVGLVDKSIVTRVDSECGARYRLLDTIREFGAELLADSALYRRRHRDYFLALARAFGAAFFGSGQADEIRRMSADHANLRLALECFLDDGDDSAGGARAGLEMATALWGFWMSTSQLGEGRYWLGRMLDQVPGARGDQAVGAWLGGLFMDGQLAKDDIVRVLKQLRSAVAASGDEVGLAWTDSFIALASAMRGDPGGTAAAYVSVLERFTRLGDRRGFAVSLLCKAIVHLLHKELAAAIAECDQVLRHLPEGECWLRGWALWWRGLASWQAGDAATAAECYRAGLRLCQRTGPAYMMAAAPFLDGLAWLAAADDDFGRTASLQGAADRIWATAVSVPRLALPPLNRQDELARQRARAALGQPEFERLYAAAAQADLPEVLRFALAAPGAVAPGATLTDPALTGAPSGRAAEARAAAPELARPATGAGAGPPAPASSAWDVLTAREREVAALVAQGLTNRDIAGRLVVSKRTVDAHVEHILAKLGFASRVQVAALAQVPAQAWPELALGQAR
jgi:predicted ATPase/DNA-binding CsgD family transcriptional regulator